MVAPIIAAAGISAASSIGGSLLSHFMSESSKRQEYERQKEFAKNGVSWRVADAERAGIHPLAALGAQTTSYSPQAAYGSDYGLGQAGQSIAQGVADYYTRNDPFNKWYDKTTKLEQVRNMELRNQQIMQEMELARFEASKSVISSQPGNPQGGISNVIPGITGSTSQHGDKSIQFMEYMPGHFKLQPGNDYSQLYEEFPLVGKAPTIAQAGIITSMQNHGLLPIDRFKKWGYVFDKYSGDYVRVNSPEYRALMSRLNKETSALEKARSKPISYPKGKNNYQSHRYGYKYR